MADVTKSQKIIAISGLVTSSLFFIYNASLVLDFINLKTEKKEVSEAEFGRLLRKYQNNKGFEMEKDLNKDTTPTSETNVGNLHIRYQFDFPFEGALNHLIHEEGISDAVYKDGRGIETIGIGHNLKANPICKGSIKAQFLCNLNMAEEGAKKFVGNEKIWASMGEYRRLAIVSMVFQMGIGEMMTWHKTREAIQQQNWKLASLRASQSRWAKDAFRGTPSRAKRVCSMLADNKLILRDGHPEYAWESLKPKTGRG